MDDLTDLEVALKVDNQLKVLICIDSFHDGGAEMFAIRLANALSKSVQIHFMELSPNQSKAKIQRNLLNSDIPLFTPDTTIVSKLLRIPTVQKVFSLLKLLKYLEIMTNREIISSICNYLKNNNLRVVNTHAPYCNLYLNRVKEKFQFRLIHTMHGHYELLRKAWGDESRFWGFVNSHLVGIDKFIYTTQDHKALLNAAMVDATKMVKVFYGMEIAKSKKRTRFDGKESLVIGMVSRADKEKGWQEVIEAVNELTNEGEKIRLEILGSGHEYGYLAEKNKNRSNILFHGYKQNVTETIESCHIGILATFYEAESLPNVIIEFLSIGKPVISTTIGAIPEMIKADDNLYAGRLISTKKGVPVKVRDIKQAIRTYLENPDLIGIESNLAFKAADKFSMQTCIESYLNVFSEIDISNEPAFIKSV